MFHVSCRTEDSQGRRLEGGTKLTAAWHATSGLDEGTTLWPEEKNTENDYWKNIKMDDYEWTGKLAECLNVDFTLLYLYTYNANIRYDLMMSYSIICLFWLEMLILYICLYACSSFPCFINGKNKLNHISIKILVRLVRCIYTIPSCLQYVFRRVALTSTSST